MDHTTRRRNGYLKGKDRQALDDMLQDAEKCRAEGMGWRIDGLGEWSTEAIFDKLREIGVHTDQEHFEEQAGTAGRCLDLAEQWRQGLALDDTP